MDEVNKINFLYNLYRDMNGPRKSSSNLFCTGSICIYLTSCSVLLVPQAFLELPTSRINFTPTFNWLLDQLNQHPFLIQNGSILTYVVNEVNRMLMDLPSSKARMHLFDANVVKKLIWIISLRSQNHQDSK